MMKSSQKPINYEKHILSVAHVPITDILESTNIPESVFLKDFIEYVLQESPAGDEFKTSVWQIPEDSLTVGVPLKEETERIRQVLITWASLYSNDLYDNINEMFELDSNNVEQIVDVQLIDGTQLLVEVELIGED